MITSILIFGLRRSNGDLQQIAPLENEGAGTTDGCMKFVHTHDADLTEKVHLLKEVTAYLHVKLLSKSILQ